MDRFVWGTGECWSPDPEAVRASHLFVLMGKLGVADVEALHTLAITEPERYYRALIEHLNIRFRQPYNELVDVSRGVPFPRWFPGGNLNIVDTCLAEGRESEAVTVLDETGSTSAIDYGSLREQTALLAARLSAAGIQQGECVGLFMPMGIESTIAFFACAWVGAIAVPAFSGYAADALRLRLDACGAKVLITSAGFTRRGRWVDMLQVCEEIAPTLPKLHTMIVAGETPRGIPRTGIWETWQEAVAIGASISPVEPCSMDPNAPLMLMYTSGTTGKPKAIVHSHAGFLVKVASDFALAFDVSARDRVCWITDLGWLVGPQMIVGTAALGASAVYYVGSIDTPDIEQIWRACAREKVTVLGLSPSAVRLMAAEEELPTSAAAARQHLRAFVSTGEPWDAASWRWLFEELGQATLPILNYSGGTEIAGGILTCYAALPIANSGFAGPVVGMDADIFGPDGRPTDTSVGELVVKNIWPGMTHSFWGADDDRYLESYWSEFPGLWRHGDLAQRDEAGWWYIRGRSDDTLKVAGRRVGPAEIETVLLQNPGVLEAVIVGVPDAMKGQSIVAFIISRDPALSEATLRAEVRSKLGPSLVPSAIYFVTGLPKTRNGKVVRRAIVARYLGLALEDTTALDDASTLLAIPQAAA